MIRIIRTKEGEERKGKEREESWGGSAAARNAEII